MKMSFHDFQSVGEKKDFLYKKIDSKTYPDEEVDLQIKALKLMFNQVKEDCKKGKSIEDAKQEIQRYIYNFIINDISKPTFNDFYVPRTQEYLSKNEEHLKKSIENFIVSKKNYKEILNNSAKKTTENLDQNVDIIIANMLDNIEKMQYVKSDKFIDLQKRIKSQKLKKDDKEMIFLCIDKLIKEFVNNYRNDCCKLIEKNPEKVYKKLMFNINNIFEVKKSQNVEEKSNDVSSQNTKFNVLTNMQKLKINSIEKANPIELKKRIEMEDSIKVKDFITNPFYSKNEDNNILIFLSEILANVDNSSLMYFYKQLEESKQNPKIKEYVLKIILANAKECKQDTLKTMLSKRIEKLMEMQDSVGYIDKYNNTNNNRLLKLNLQELTIDSEELKNILKVSNSNISSTEIGIALSAFYVNRTAKILPAFLRASFILDKNNVFKSIYENPQIEFEELQLSAESVKQNMAEYDGLSELITQRCIKNKKEMDKDSNVKPDIDLDEIKSYKVFYETKYHNFYEDLKNVLTTSHYKKYFYLIKDYSISSLIYTAETTSKNDIINWGYVIGDKNEDKEKILLGFDIESLNMPLFLHMNKDDLTKIVDRITGKTIIPVYEGASSWIGAFNKSGRMSTQVLYPITKKQRKFLLKSPKTADSKNAIVNHFKWLQNPKLKPSYIKVTGSRMYDIATGNIIIENQDTSDDVDDPNR
ncbi:MAG: hypothetical protein J6K42_04790 [Clostridia bacterium]|nr:hypothetical protein [Clostridia bacterium]